MRVETLKILDTWLRGVKHMLRPRKLAETDLGSSSILIIKLSAMGDALCMLPAVRMLSQAFPDAEIDWLTTQRANPGLFDKLDFLREIILVPTGIRRLLVFLPTLIGKCRRYDLIVDFDQYYSLSEMLAWLGRRSVGFRTPIKGSLFSLAVKYDASLNEKLQFRNLVQDIIATWNGCESRFDPCLKEIVINADYSPNAQKNIEKVKSVGLPVLVMYPGSSENAKFRRWDWPNYQVVIEHFRDRCSIVIAGGPDEESIAQMLHRSEDRAFNWINLLSLRDWALFFYKESPILVGNDGGLLHIADAVGLPVVSIFGPSLFSKWGSLHEQSIGLEKKLGCRPCLKNYLGIVPTRCWKGTNECLDMIPPAEVIRELEKRIKQS
jgi:ADP-heptose:LPS heptosyltransferase